MQRCINCIHSRQAADRSRQDVVGCPRITDNSKLYWEAEGQLYQGWFYSCRRPGDTGDTDNTISRGAIINGILIDSDGYCSGFEENYT